MKLRRLIYSLFAVCFSSSVLESCSSDAYDTGDGNLSYLCAEFVDVYTSSDTIVTKAVTDDGVELQLAQRIKTVWTSVPDSTFRALLYYAKGDNPVKVFSLLKVPVLLPKQHADTLATDPLTVESVWTGSNGKYVNLSLLLKTGAVDGDAQQQWLSLVADADYSGDGSGLLLLHAQNGVPQYYTSRVYVSIPLHSLPQWRPLVLRANTYGGMRTYRLQ